MTKSQSAFNGMNNTVKVSDIMSKKVIILDPDDSIEPVTRLFEQHNFDGFPVANKDGQLIGIVTAYDMVSQSYSIHLTPLINMVEDLDQSEASTEALRSHFARVKAIKVRDIMNEDPLVTSPDVRVEDLAKEFIQHHRVNPIPVIGSSKNLIGIVSRFDIIRFFDEQYLHKILLETGHKGILQRLGRMDET